MADYLGSFDTSTTVYFYFTTHAATGAPVAPSSGFENADLLIYKNGSATQRTSASGITMTSPFDSVTGLHAVAIDLSDNTDAGFYAAGSEYAVVLSPDETVDSLAVVKVLAYFSIERTVKVNVTKFGGTAGTFASGRPEVNMTHIAGSSVSTSTAQLGVNVVNFGGSAGTFASGRPEVNTSHIAGSSVSTSTAQIGVNVVNFGGSAGTFASGIPAVNTTQFAGSAITSASGIPEVKVASIANNAITASAIADAAIDAATFASDALARFGVVTSGTAQSATSTTIVLASATSFTDDYLNGATIYITGGTGAGQRALITDWVNSTDTATVDTWITTPDNTSTYVVFATPPSSSTAPVNANVTQVSGDSTAADVLELFAEILDQSTGQIDSGSFASGAITSSALAASCIGSSQLATGCITSSELHVTALSAIQAYVWDATASSYETAGTTGKRLADILDDTGTSGVIVASLASGSITASVIATDAIDVNEISAAACNKIADHVRRRTQANVEASSYGDTLSVGSEYGLIQQAQESNTTSNAGKLTVYKTDGTTELAQRTITTDNTAEPITGIS